MACTRHKHTDHLLKMVNHFEYYLRIITLVMAQTTVNERIKILIDALGMSVNAFSKSIDVPTTTMANYLKRGSSPKTQLLAKVLNRFEHVNSVWLYTGEGQMLLNSGNVAEPSATIIKKNSGNSIGINSGTATQTQQLADHDCAVKLEAAQQLIEQLRSQLQDKEHIIQLLSKPAK
jgi:DNA-binding transcriptional regulator YiaG